MVDLTSTNEDQRASLFIKTVPHPQQFHTLTVPIINTMFVPPLPTIPWKITFMVSLARQEGEHKIILNDCLWNVAIQKWFSVCHGWIGNHYVEVGYNMTIDVDSIIGCEKILDAIVIREFVSKLMTVGDDDKSVSVKNDILDKAKRLLGLYLSARQAQELVKELSLNTNRFNQLRQDAFRIVKHPSFHFYRSYL